MDCLNLVLCLGRTFQEVPQLVDFLNIDETHCLSLLHLLRITAWILRFVNIQKKGEPFSNHLTAKEFQDLKLKWDLYI